MVQNFTLMRKFKVTEFTERSPCLRLRHGQFLKMKRFSPGKEVTISSAVTVKTVNYVTRILCQVI